MRNIVLVAVLLVAGSAFAQTTSTSTTTSSSTSSSTSTSLRLTATGGVLASAQTATGPGGRILCIAQGAKVLIVDVIGTNTPAMTIQLEHSNDAVSWAVVTTTAYAAATGVTLSTGVPAISWSVNTPPLGCYRTNVTAYSSGTVDVSYRADL